MTKRRITKEIKSELDRIRERAKDRRLHWQDVVEAAKSKSSPLHSYFDWDPRRAMASYLQQQAEGLIGRYTTVIPTEDGRKIRTRAHVSLSIDRQSGGGYRSIIEVLSSKELKEQLLADAFNDLAAFKERYKKLRELSEVFVAIEKVERKRGKAKPDRRGATRGARTSRSVGVGSRAQARS